MAAEKEAAAKKAAKEAAAVEWVCNKLYCVHAHDIFCAEKYSTFILKMYIYVYVIPIIKQGKT